MTPPQEYKLIPVRECPWDSEPVKDTGQTALSYWKQCIASQSGFDVRLEHSAMVLLDKERRLMGHVMLARGGETWVPMDSWLALGGARHLGAGAILLVHNHPSSNPEPSAMDRLCALMFARQAEYCEIELADFVTVTEDEACSFAANGFLVQAEEPDAEVKAAQEEDRLWMFAAELLLPDRELQLLLFDAARQAGVAPHIYIRDWARGLLKKHLKGETDQDPALTFLAAVMGNAGELALLDRIYQEAAETGCAAFHLPWKLGVEKVREYFKAQIGAAA